MTKAIKIYETGGPEVLKYEDVEVGDPGEGEIRIRQTASGLNFIDCYQRSGLYPMDLPCVLGSEAAGVVEAVGPGVDMAIGQRVAYAGARGSYAEERLIPAGAVVPVPEEYVMAILLPLYVQSKLNSSSSGPVTVTASSKLMVMVTPSAAMVAD